VPVINQVLTCFHHKAAGHLSQFDFNRLTLVTLSGHSSDVHAGANAAAEITDH